MYYYKIVIKFTEILFNWLIIPERKKYYVPKKKKKKESIKIVHPFRVTSRINVEERKKKEKEGRRENKFVKIIPP